MKKCVRGMHHGDRRPALATSAKIAWVLWFLIPCGVSGVRAPGAERVLDRFDYKDNTTARTIWQARESSPPVRAAANGGLFFDCPFARAPDDRFFWDRDVTWDLSGDAALILDLDAAHPDAFRSLAFYLKSGDGWYIWNRPLPRSGRQRITLYRDDFETEGNPAGWDRIERFRLSPWRGSRTVDTRLRMYSIRASTPPVLLLRATESVPNNDERAAAQRATRYLSRRVTALGIPHAVIDENELTAPMLASAHVVILGYNPLLPDGLYDQIAAFLDRGGKAMVFYSADSRLARRMGFELGDYRAATVPFQWSAFLFNDPGAWQTPSRVLQHSWNIRPVQPVRADAEIIAWWENAEGDPSGDPAWGASRDGTWMTHILLEGDNTNKENLLAGLLTRWIPSLWPDIVAAAMKQTGRIGSHATLEQAVAAIDRDSRALTPSQRKKAVGKLDLAMQCHARAQRASAAARHIQAFSLARAARRLLVEAMARTLPPRPEEFRGVWDHHAVGWYPGDWGRTARELRDSIAFSA